LRCFAEGFLPGHAFISVLFATAFVEHLFTIYTVVDAVYA
jgi:hypothetical protein